VTLPSEIMFLTTDIYDDVKEISLATMVADNLNGFIDLNHFSPCVSVL